ncbi:MAG: hypothetical protein ACKO9F_08960 [Caldilinea sp.]
MTVMTVPTKTKPVVGPRNGATTRMQVKVSVEHRQQTERAGCLAACAQMALQHIHVYQSQVQLNRLLGLTPEGTPSSRVRRLSELGVDNLLRYPLLIEADLQEAHARFGAADSLRPGRVCGTFMIESRGSKGVVRGDQAYGG